MATHTIVTIVGSLRKESFTLKVANALAKLAPATLKLDVTTLDEFPSSIRIWKRPRRPTGWRSAKSCRSRTACCS